MNEIERAMIDNVQRSFPLVPRPFRTIGDRLGITEDRCITMLKELSDTGILRSIRAVLSWNKIGFSTILIGMKVHPEYIEQIAQKVNSINNVTHNYTREGLLNLWFTLIFECEAEKETILTKLKTMQGVEDMREFKAEKTYKIGLVLDV